MSIFDELGLEDPKVIDPTENLPAGTYRAALTACKVVPSKKDASKNNVQFTYKVSEGDYKGKAISEYKSANQDDDPQIKGWLKARLKSLGWESGQTPGDLVGKSVAIKVVKNGQYTNVNEVVLLDDNGGVVANHGSSVAATQNANPEW